MMAKHLMPVGEKERAEALAGFTGRLRQLRENGFNDPQLIQAFRDRARAAKLEFLSRPDHYLGQLTDKIESGSGQVHFASDATEARRQIMKICQKAGASQVVKGKSITCEEIELNPALEAAGMQVSETDLGEFIIQLAGEPPFHILGPAMHKTRHEVAELFSRLFEPVSSEPAELTALARKVLRQRFLDAEVGITGVNAIACDTGTLAVITNEGNGRFCSTLPRVHIAVMGLEKAVPTLQDLAVITSLLPRAALGWPISSYVSWISGAAGKYHGAGPEEFHLVILDNGRSQALASPYWEILLCLRCSSCLNYCPVYNTAGGHNYGWVYAGPMGSVLTPLLRGEPGDERLSQASTLCGRCREKCPMGIDLPGLLLKRRQESVPPLQRLMPRLAAEMLSKRPLFESACRLARPFVTALSKLDDEHMPPGPWRGWRQGRKLPEVSSPTLVGDLRHRKGPESG
jgi:L-lactate dehydrogenase complex protein LldF